MAEGLCFVEPMLPSLLRIAPEGDDWLHEIKHDGYRAQLIIDQSDVRAFTRRGLDWSERYKPVTIAAQELRCSSAIIDGEMIVQDEQGRSDFQAFDFTLNHEPDRLVFMAFDLLHIDGADLRSDRLIDRRARLQSLVNCRDPDWCIQFSEHLIGGGRNMFKACEGLGLEGIVSKKIDSRYSSGLSLEWVKTKCWAESAFVVVGVEPLKGGPSMALLAVESDAGLEFAGFAAVTLVEPDRDHFWREVQRLSTDRPSISVKIKAVQWLRPELRVRARYLKGEEKLHYATLTALLEN